MTPPLLRPPTAHDADALSSLFTELGHPTTASAIPERLRALFAEGGHALLATSETGEPLGVITLARYMTLHHGPVAYITALVTTASARGTGVGKALVRASWEWARGAGCARLAVTSHEHRADAHAFYQALGLPYTGRRFSAPIGAGPT